MASFLNVLGLDDGIPNLMRKFSKADIITPLPQVYRSIPHTSIEYLKDIRAYGTSLIYQKVSSGSIFISPKSVIAPQFIPTHTQYSEA